MHSLSEPERPDNRVVKNDLDFITPPSQGGWVMKNEIETSNCFDRLNRAFNVRPSPTVLRCRKSSLHAHRSSRGADVVKGVEKASHELHDMVGKCIDQ